MVPISNTTFSRIRMLIGGLTVENEVILDPMLGSGTTAIAACKLNRRFIGIEIQKDIFNIAKSRISELLPFLYLTSSKNE